jgi:hypothetical protein
MKRCRKCESNLPESSFGSHKDRSDGLQSYCRECQRAYHHTYAAEHSGAHRNAKYRDRHPERARSQTAAYYRSYRALLRPILESVICVDCGQDDSHYLRFHHRDPKTKEFEIGAGSRSHETLMREIAKCDVVCAKCHCARHRDLARQT